MYGSRPLFGRNLAIHLHWRKVCRVAWWVGQQTRPQRMLDQLFHSIATVCWKQQEALPLQSSQCRSKMMKEQCRFHESNQKNTNSAIDVIVLLFVCFVSFCFPFCCIFVWFVCLFVCFCFLFSNCYFGLWFVLFLAAHLKILNFLRGHLGSFFVSTIKIKISTFLNSHYFQLYFTFYSVKIGHSVPILQLIKVNCTTQANIISYVSYCFSSSYIYFVFYCLFKQ